MFFALMPPLASTFIVVAGAHLGPTERLWIWILMLLAMIPLLFPPKKVDDAR